MEQEGTIAGTARAEPHRRPAWWPAGTTTFAFKTWLALGIGLYAAFFFQLEGASSCGV